MRCDEAGSRSGSRPLVVGGGARLGLMPKSNRGWSFDVGHPLWLRHSHSLRTGKEAGVRAHTRLTPAAARALGGEQGPQLAARQDHGAVRDHGEARVFAQVKVLPIWGGVLQPLGAPSG